MSFTPPPINVKNLTLITGGARSGKSSFAEQLAAQTAGTVLYIATMEELRDDPEALERIQRHRDRRPSTWETLEIPFEVHNAVRAISGGTKVCLIDCLSLYVSNMLLALSEKSASTAQLEKHIETATNQLLVAMKEQSGIHFIVVTNEVGAGIVPEHKLARSYRDLLGVVNQQFAQAADTVWLSCVGLQIKLKPQNS